MAKSKWPLIEPKLALVEKWARDGLTEKQIAINLGVGKTTFERYKREKPELLERLKAGRAVDIAEVENALNKKARGFTYTETKTYIKKENGKRVEYTEVTEKYSPPDTRACEILLLNKDRDSKGKTKWSRDPAKLEIERELAELKKKIQEMSAF